VKSRVFAAEATADEEHNLSFPLLFAGGVRGSCPSLTRLGPQKARKAEILVVRKAGRGLHGILGEEGNTWGAMKLDPER